MRYRHRAGQGSNESQKVAVRIVSGSHQELLKKGGIYADLYFTQSANLFTENQNP